MRSTPFTPFALVLAVLATGAAGCGGDSTAPPKPASVAPAVSGSLSGTVGLAVVPAPEFIVRDGSGNALSNVAVTVVVSGGGGTLTGAPTKTQSGATPIGAWTLGTTAGTNTVTITVAGLPPLVMTVTGAPDVPSQLTVASGGSQSAPAAGLITTPVVFKVADKFNNGVPGVVVTYSVTAGGGSIAGGGQAVTDATGLASATGWTLGTSTVPQQLRATAGALSANATATVASSFNLDVRFFGPAVEATIQNAFITAAQRIQGFVTGDLADVNVTSFSVSACGVTGVAPLTETIDDVIVFANVAPIDGVGGVLGSAGPCFVRTTGGLTLIGVMNFDVADLQNLQTTNRLYDVILHEMLHTLGFGTLWASKGQVSGAGTANSAFIGLQAIAGCQFHGGAGNCTTSIPLETTGGSGTRDVHWRETTSSTGIGFRTELMTGFVSAPGVANPLSRMSIGSLADLGYVVNVLPNDAYTVPSSLVAAFDAIRDAQGLGVSEINDAVRAPIGAVDRGGRVTLFSVRR